MLRFIKLVLLMCIVVNTSFLVFAEEALTEINVEVTGYEAKISGSADTYKGTEVSIMVLKPGKDIFSVLEDAAATEITSLNNNALCIAQTSTDENNKFEYTCKFDSNEKSGNYKLRVQVYGEEKVRESVIKFENASRSTTGLSNLQTNNITDLKTALEEYGSDIHIESGEKYNSFSDKEKEYVYTNVAADSIDKKQQYIASVGEIQAVKELKALDMTALKSKVDSGSIIGVNQTQISEYNALSDFNKEIFISDLYSDLKNRETPYDVEGAFVEALNEINASISQNPPVTYPSQGSTSGGGFSSGSVSISGGVASNPDKPYVIETPKNEGFTDMEGALWAKTAVNTLYERGIINGKGENKFCPNETVKREEFLKMVIESLNLVGISEEGKVFSDTDKNAWYMHYIDTGVGCGLINGISENEFGVGRSITREDMATILYRAVKYGEVSLYSTSDTVFTDKSDISEYALEAVQALSSAKVINGMEDGSFMPKKTATRAEAAMMLYNLLYR